MDYKKQYLKYKHKYLKKLNIQSGGVPANCNGETINNVALLLKTGSSLNRILILRDIHSKKWMIPGGGIEHYDISANQKRPCWQAIKREFQEEVNRSLDLNSLIDHNSLKKLNINHSNGSVTKIYIAKTKHKFKFVPNNEVDAHYFIKISDVKDILNGRSVVKNGMNIVFKDFVFNSLQKLRDKGFL